MLLIEHHKIPVIQQWNDKLYWLSGSSYVCHFTCFCVRSLAGLHTSCH